MNTVMELEIGPGPDPGSYVVHVLQSVGGGEPTQTITIDLDELVDRRPLLEATVLSSSVSARRVMSDTEAVVQDVGRRLFDATFSGERPLRVPHQHGGRVRAGLERADRAAPHRARARRIAVGGPLRRRGRRVPVPQGTARAPRAGTALAARPVDRAADARAGHDLLAARAAGARRGRREGAARGGLSAASRLGARRARVARRGDVERRARQAARAGVARAALRRATAPTTWRRTRACWRSSDAMDAPTTSRHRASPISSTRPSRHRDSSC